MDELRKTSTKERALRINLDTNIYGSFAEIGAGQEIAAHFFKAGGASGTIAKSISAYDMDFSDAIYGKHDRYVCETRLKTMLDLEYSLLEDRLSSKSSHTRFFAIANTVEALNYGKTNRPHGWFGCKFQLYPNSEPNICVIHVKMHDYDGMHQQAALGIVGVNLLYACMFIHDPGEFLNALTDDLSSGRIEIDMFKLKGDDFTHVDNRLMSLKLVKNGLTSVAVFGPDGNVHQPSEMLYKKNVLILRGRFRPVTHVNVDMLLAARRHFKVEKGVEKHKIVVLSELTLTDLSADGEIDEQDFLSRVDIICSLGQNVMISNYPEYYRLVEYLSKYTKGYKLGIILGVHNLTRVLDERYYTDIRGGLLEACGHLFGGNMKMYVYPSKRKNEDGLYTLDSLKLSKKLKPLLSYLRINDKITQIDDANIENLDIISDNVLEMIKNDENGWEKYVPKKVASAIKENFLFGFCTSNKVKT